MDVIYIYVMYDTKCIIEVIFNLMMMLLDSLLLLVNELSRNLQMSR